jgi:DNA-binding CsgD family transcriptional regulator
VALMILRGHSSMSIGLRLGVSAQTVKVFRKQLYARCGISSQAELFALMMPLLKGRELPAGLPATGSTIISA